MVSGCYDRFFRYSPQLDTSSLYPQYLAKMQEKYIYVVGKPDVNPSLRKFVNKLGFKLGILVDANINLRNSESFDRIEHVQYEDIDSEISRLASSNLSVAGLLCTFENYIVAKAKLSAQFGVPSISVNAAQIATDKSLMRQAFLAADRSITPEFATIENIDQALAFAETYGYPVIIKPTNLVKSLLVLRCNNETELIAHFDHAQRTINSLYDKYKIYDREPQLIIEEFITGKLCSVAAFVDSTGTPHFCDGIAELTSAQDIGVDDNYLFRRKLPGTFSEELTAKLYRVAEKGIAALELRSVPAHVELIYNDAGVKIIEIGARIGGYRPRMYGQSYGINLREQEVLLALDEKVNLKGTFKKYCAVYELFPDRRGTFMSISESPGPDIFAYFRVTATPDTIIGQAKDGFKAAGIVIVSEENQQVFSEKCALAERMKVEVSA
jgi:hypothetical protein